MWKLRKSRTEVAAPPVEAPWPLDENGNADPWGLIDCHGLADLLRRGPDKVLVIDSRSFLEFNTARIQQSSNVCCSKLVKRRLQQGMVHVRELLRAACGVEVEEGWHIVVYDQCSEDPALLTQDNFVYILLQKLAVSFSSVTFLKGGFLTFQAMYPALCESKWGSRGIKGYSLTSMSQPCLPVSNIGPTRILPFLYLGSQQDALSQEVIQVIGVSFILNVSMTCPKPGFIQDSHFCRIPINDNYTDELQPFFPAAFQFLDKVREANGCVLVHCLAGISRSPTLAMAYIMKHMNMSADDAYRYVKDKRPMISPNFNFLGQLLQWQQCLKREELESLRRSSEGEAVRKPSTRASPFVMDLQLCSPSSPGPRSHRPLFPFDLPPPTSVTSGAKTKGKAAPCMLSPSLEVAEERMDSCPSTPAEDDKSGEMVLTVEKIASATKRSFTLSLGLSSPTSRMVESSPAAPCSSASLASEATGLPGPKRLSTQDGCEAVMVSHPAPPQMSSLPGSRVRFGTSPGCTESPGGVSEPSAGFPGTSTGFPGPSAGFPGPSVGLPGPSAVFPGPSAVFPGPSAGFPGPPMDLPGPSADFPGPSSGFPGPSAGFPGPSAGCTEPSAGFPGPSTVLPELSTGLPGPPTDLPGPSTGSSEPSTDYPEPSAGFPGPSSGFPGPSAGLLELSPGPPRPSSIAPDAAVVPGASPEQDGSSCVPGPACLPGPSIKKKLVENAGQLHPARPSTFPESSGFPGPCDLAGASVLPGPSPECVSTISPAVHVPGLTPTGEFTSTLPGGPASTSLTGFPGPRDHLATITLPAASISTGGSKSDSKPDVVGPCLTASLPEVGPTVELPVTKSERSRTARPSSVFALPVSSGGWGTAAASSPSPSPMAKRKAAMALPGLPSPTSGLAQLRFSPTTEPARAGLPAARTNRLSMGSLSSSPLASPCSARVRLSFDMGVSKQKPALEVPTLPSRTQQIFDLSICKMAAGAEARSALARTWPPPDLSDVVPRMEVETAFTGANDESDQTNSKTASGFGHSSAGRTHPGCDLPVCEPALSAECSSGNRCPKDASALSAPGPSGGCAAVAVSGEPSACSSVCQQPAKQSTSVRSSGTSGGTLQLSDFPMTSLDQLNFTPCVAGDDIKLRTKLCSGGGTKRPLSESSTPSPTSPNSSPCHVVSSPSASSSSSLSSALSSAPASEGRPEPASPMSVDSSGFSSGSSWPLVSSPTSPTAPSTSTATATGCGSGVAQGQEGGPTEGRDAGEGEGKSGEGVSPMEVSYPGISPTTAQLVASTVVKRRSRENKAKRPMVRPNSIAFSSYPTFDLTAGSQEATGQASQDDASEAYMIRHGKKSKPTLMEQESPSPTSSQRYRWGYCDSAIYRQISAAMESAMLQTRIQQASRKARSLDDILAPDDSGGENLCQCAVFGNALPHCSHSPGLFERLPCRCRGSSDPYQSNSSISSSGSHSSVHSSLEIIQVS